MIADYYKRKLLNDTPDVSPSEYKIQYWGQPQIKVGGSFKTYSIPEIENCSWEIIGLDESKYQYQTTSNSIQLKILSDYELIGSVFTLKALSNSVEIASLEIEVISL